MKNVSYPIGPVEEGHCGWCGVKNPPSKGAKPRKWCSKICCSRAAEFRRIGSAPGGSSRVVPTSCKGCGAEISQGERSRNPKIWCSQSCRTNYNRGPVNKRSSYYQNQLVRNAESVRQKNLSLPDNICPHCGNTTPRTSAGRPLKYCSNKCSSAFSYEKAKASADPCSVEGCEKPGVAKGMCGGHYSAVWRAANPDKHTAKNLRYRAQKRHEGAESFSRVEVMELSNWTCHICGGEIDRDCEYPNTLYGTVDHVVPLSKGGTHTIDNVKAAHHVCNSTKRDKEDYVHVG